MDNIFIGGGITEMWIFNRSILLFFSLFFVIISLGTMPGTIGHKAKYVRKDNLKTELGLQQISIPVTLLSFTIFFLIVNIAINFKMFNFLKK